MVALGTPSADASGYDLVPRAVRRSAALRPVEVLIYGEVLSFSQANKHGAFCTASVRSLGAPIGLGERAARKALRNLIDLGLLREETRVTKTNRLHPQELTTELVLKLKPREATDTCWRALMAQFPLDSWVIANCPDRVLTPAPSDDLPWLAPTPACGAPGGVTPANDPLRGAERACRPYKEESIASTISLPQKVSPSSSEAVPHRGPSPGGHDQTNALRTQTMPRKIDRSKDLGMLGALNSPGRREEVKRREARKEQHKTSVLKRAPKVAAPLSPLDLIDVAQWKNHDFINLVRAVGRAVGVKLWCDEQRPDGEYATSITRLNMDMRDLLNLLESSGVRGKRQQAVFLRSWLASWPEFAKGEPSATRVGFAPRYWMAAWSKVFPKIRLIVQSRPDYQGGAEPVATEVRDEIMRKVRDHYPTWPDDEALEAKLVKVLTGRLIDSRPNIESLLYQKRIDPAYADLWTTLKTCRKA